MNLRLTPLNIISSISLVNIAYLLVCQDGEGLPGSALILLAVLLIMSFISDLVFRRLITDLKRIWLIELLFIIFVIVLILLIRTQFN